MEAVPIGLLLRADSPRRLGENDEHVRALAESEEPLPPIVVHRPSMRVIDGMHRLLAARWRGSSEIEVQFFDGPTEDAFVLAVRANVGHGLPLSLADRTAAAARIIHSHPDLSDRAIASLTGLSAKTVGAQRLRAFGPLQQSARIGRDGRVRPLNSAQGRRIAARLIAEDPTASLRTIARKAGISPGTVRDVRERLKRGDNPVPSRRQPGSPKPASKRMPPPRPATPPPAHHRYPARMPAEAREAMFRSLCRDPSLRMTETGRLLLRMMELHLTEDHQWHRIVEAVPAHCADSISAMATACAEVWQELAALLREPASA